MTKKKFDELIEQAQKEMYEENHSFFYALGGFIYVMQRDNLTLTANQFREIVTKQINQRW